MDLKVLRYFLTVVREESITAASEFLHLTQPTLSRQLSALEEELGVTLFIRGSRKITLTDEGMLLRKRAEEILELVHKTEAEFLFAQELVHGDIYVGCGETHAMSLVVQIIREMREEYPNIRVHIYSGDADEVIERINKGLLDFGVLISPEDLTNFESLRLPNKNKWGVLMRKDSLFASLECITPEILLDMPLICARQRDVDKKVTKWVGVDYKKLNIVSTYNLIFNAALMVENGIGNALCLDGLVSTSEECLLCYRPLSPELGVDIHIVWKKYRTLSKAAEVFLGRLKAACQSFT
ncbi:LysR family transcriptional regulator [Vibrio mangrovi]|uniref:HTH-type transcriptional regulator CatM n=1 Tax=Vibrio mangrovi TaxID=474394 RepID=A0A1Y6J124_9VIBR|nr:LysR family transcriptional regulator [Vibrio mangrovi]MDW6002468.1 LysR family transcriptional regulator [Vibrio mangrovi]SMS02003.1 HTH-type transcriptional regulator CatM [Vibrio mangrovi]